MGGREFLQSARLLLTAPSEPNRRTAAGRAYYALLHEGRVVLERWGFPIPPRDNIHPFVRLRFSYARNADLKTVGKALEQLGNLRNRADYRLATPGPFGNDQDTVLAIDLSQSTIDLLDALDADPARRAAAVAAIRAAWP